MSTGTMQSEGAGGSGLGASGQRMKMALTWNADADRETFLSATTTEDGARHAAYVKMSWRILDDGTPAFYSDEDMATHGVTDRRATACDSCGLSYNLTKNPEYLPTVPPPGTGGFFVLGDCPDFLRLGRSDPTRRLQTWSFRPNQTSSDLVVPTQPDFVFRLGRSDPTRLRLQTWSSRPYQT
jgi:hypothetical protein